MIDSATHRVPPQKRRPSRGIAVLYLLVPLTGSNTASLTIVTNTPAHATMSQRNNYAPYKNGQPHWLSQAKQEVETLRLSNPDWKTAFKLADMVILTLDDVGLKPDRIIPSSDEGVSFYFFKENGYALLQCLESQEIIALEKPAPPEEQRVWEVPLDTEAICQTALQIKNFTTNRFNEHTAGSFIPA